MAGKNLNTIFRLLLSVGAFGVCLPAFAEDQLPGDYQSHSAQKHFLTKPASGSPSTGLLGQPAAAGKLTAHPAQSDLSQSATMQSADKLSDGQSFTFKPSSVSGDVDGAGVQGLDIHIDHGTADVNQVRSYFSRMVSAAKDYTPQLHEAISTYKASEEDVKQAKGQRLPQVNVGFQSDPAQFGSGEKVPEEDMSTTGVSINMTTPVFDWGHNNRTIESKEYTAKAAQNNYNAQLEDTAYQVCSQLTELAKQRLIYAYSQKFVERMEKLVKMIQDISKIDAGRISELTQAQARLLQAEASRDDALIKIHNAEIALQKLTGYSSYSGLPAQEAWGINMQDSQELFRDMENHPAIVQAKNESLAAFQQAKAVKAGNLPQLNWVVSKTIPVNNDAYEEQWQTYLNVSWPLFQGGSGNAAENAAAMRAEAAQQKIDEQKLDLDNKLKTAIHNTQSMLDQARQYHQLVIATNQVRKDFFEQWRQLDTRSLLDVLSAESDYYNNQVNEVTSRFSAYDAIFNGYASAGILSQWLGVK